HIVLDGWCNALLFRDFTAYYEALRAGATPARLAARVEAERSGATAYGDYVRWARRQDPAAALAHWDAVLAGAQGGARIEPLAPPRPGGRTAASAKVVLDRPAVERLRSWAAAAGVTPSTLVCAAWGVVLQRLTGRSDVVFGQVVSGRDAPLRGIAETVGLFINTVPVRVTRRPGATARELARAVQEHITAATPHHHCPLAEIQRRTAPDARLVTTAVIFESAPLDLRDMAGIAGVELSSTAAEQRFGFPIGVAADLRDRLELAVAYDPRVYADSDAERVARLLARVLRTMADAPDAPLDAADLRGTEDLAVIAAANRTAAPYPADATITSLVAAQAAADGDAPAVISAGRVLSRGELDARAGRLAGALAAAGVRRGDIVALSAHRGTDLVVGLLGILKAGAAYLPLDPMHPAQRQAGILADARPAALVTAGAVPPIPAGLPALPVLDAARAGDPGPDPAPPPEAAGPADAAYCLFTSGSTGRPKGVVVEHRNVVNYCLGAWLRDYLGPDPVMVSTTNYSFDIFVTECWAPLVLGFPTVIATDRELEDPAAFAALMAARRPTVIQATPSKAAFLLGPDPRAALASVKSVILGGEAFSADLFRRIAGAGDAAVYNVYGPTEATVWATGRRIETADAVDIGRPLANYRAHILDGTTPLGIGMPGELCLAGDGVARGYLGAPELTAERFIASPLEAGPLYRTGDLARWLPNGAIGFLGRADGQIKLRGLRIELGEIAAALREAPGVRDAAAAVQGDGGEAGIVGYYVADGELDPQALSRHCAGLLPGAMVPHAFGRLDAIPLNRSGKLDAAALPRLDAAPAAAFAEPRGAGETLVAGVFAEILPGRGPMGALDSFFARGGHSLHAARAVNVLEARTGLRISLKDFFADPTPRAIARRLDAADPGAARAVPSAGGPGRHPASPAQRRMLTADEFDDAGTAYNVTAAFLLDGPVDPDRLAGAFARLVERHEALRTRLEVDRDGVWQEVAAEAPARLELDRADVLDRDAAAALTEAFVRPFDLGAAPLARMRWVRGPGLRSLLLLDAHHAVADGTSMTVLLEDFCAFHNGREPGPAGPSYPDYTRWLGERDTADDAEYWVGEFAEPPEPLELPVDFRRPPTRSHAGAAATARLDRALRERVSALAAAEGATEFSVLLAAAMTLFAKYGRTEDLAVGVPVAGRDHAAFERTVGMFVDTVGLRGRPAAAKTFRAFLREIHATQVAGQEHQGFPLEELVERLGLDRDRTRHPLFDVAVAFQNAPEPTAWLDGAAVEPITPPRRAARFDLALNIAPAADGYRVDAEYRTDLFRAESVDLVLRHFEVLLGDAVARPDATLGELSMADAAERALLARDWNATAAPFAADATLPELFAANVRRHPDKTAVACDREALSFAQLDEASGRIAARLAEAGVAVGDRVALSVPRGVGLLAGALGIVKAGAAWVPVDPTFPAARAEHILADSGATAVLAGTDFPGRIGDGVRLLDLRHPSLQSGAFQPVEPRIGPLDLAYCIYTSGTTGQPKGVMVPHRGIANLAAMLAQDLHVAGEDRVLAYANPVFDASVIEWTTGLVLGATIEMVPEERLADPAWVNRLIAERCTAAILTPAVMANLDVSPLRLVVSGGAEAMGPKGYTGLFVNGYGPTEAVVCSTAWSRPAGQTGYPDPIPIGRPCANCGTWVVDSELRLTGLGVPGELLVSAPALARGYLGLEELTARAFIPNPHGPGLAYRTGDLVRWDPDGQLVFMGRLDGQVKIRGVRIELEGIQTILRTVPGVRDAAAVVRADPSGADAIHAFIVGGDADAARRVLAERLPANMVPSAVAVLDELPTTRSGKLDTAALPAIQARPADYSEPATPAEVALAAAFAAVLGARRVGAEDRFFALGGDSIKAIRVVSALRAAGWSADARDLMSRGAVREVARSLTPVAAAEARPPLTGPVPLSPIQRRFFAAGHAEPGHFGQSVMLAAPDGFEPAALRAALDALAGHHDMLRAAFPAGGAGPALVGPVAGAGLPLEIEDLRGGPADPALAEARATAVQAGFDPEAGALARAVLFRTDAADHLLLAAHHLVVDAVSWQIMLEDLGAAYAQARAGRETALPARTASYRDWV
ncbi:MAG: amino acid adenylation domain-containing protein, partial [Bifidobacteriaceae bacterium]|nr:amino acid adenylation domain-containing protein [Bifidobacteriaceae bacterium]